MYDGDEAEPRGGQGPHAEAGRGWAGQGGAAGRPAVMPHSAHHDVEIRILCPTARAGCVIGKGGDVIRRLREETGAQVTMNPVVPGAHERVVAITAADVPSAEWCPSQRAAFRVHARVMVDDPDVHDDDHAAVDRAIAASDAGGAVVRLLVRRTQIGCLLGVGGAVINQMRESSGAQVRVMPKEVLPACAQPGDELVHISGEPRAVRRAFEDATARLRAYPPVAGRAAPPRGRHVAAGDEGREGRGSSAGSFGGGTERRVVSELPPPPPGRAYLGNPGEHGRGHPGGGWDATATATATGWGGGGGGERATSREGYARGDGDDGRSTSLTASPSPSPPPDRDPRGVTSSPPFSPLPPPHTASVPLPPTVEAGTEMAYRLLCPVNRAGFVIGKRGEMIRAIREQTAAKIKVLDPVPGDEERVVVITCGEDGDRFALAPAQVALFRIFARVAGEGAPAIDGGPAASSPSHPSHPPFRLLVPSQQIGCLLGEGGAVMRSIRETTGAHVRMVPREHLPACALPGDELVEIAGTPSLACSAAIRAVSTRLRTFNGPASPAAGGPSASPRRSRGGQHGAGAPGGTSPMGEGGGRRGQGAGAQRGLGVGAVGGMPSRAGPGGFDFGGGGGFGVSATELAALVTAHLRIPVAQIGSLIGRGGAKINWVRSSSGAKVKLHDSVPNAPVRMLELSGTDNQVSTARRLVERLLVAEQETQNNLLGQRRHSGQMYE